MQNITRNGVVAYFQNEEAAREAVDDLASKGFNRSNIHISNSRDYATDAARGGAGLTGRNPEETHHHGGIIGWFESLFGSNDYDDDSRYYSDAVRRGGCVVAVEATDEERDTAIDILNRHGAASVEEESSREGRTGRSDYPSDRRTKTAGSSESIPVVKEELHVGKRVVQRGGVRVYSQVIEEPVEQQVNLRDEKVRVDRQRVDRPVTDADRANLRDQTIEVTETAEEPVVQKTARVVEEVRVGKEANERTETVRDKVRRTEVRTEPVEGTSRERAATVSDDYDEDFRRDFNSRYASTGADYTSYSPAYMYGYTAASNPQYRGRSWNEVEPALQSDYSKRYPGSTWERMKDAVRYGWDRVTRKR